MGLVCVHPVFSSRWDGLVGIFRLLAAKADKLKEEGGMATALCLWEGEGYDREKQVCWSFDLKCSSTSPVQGWLSEALENWVSPCVCPGMCDHFIGVTGLAGGSHSGCTGIVLC